MVAGILVEQVTGRPLHQVYRELVFGPAGMGRTWLEGHEPARTPDAAHHYSGELDWAAISARGGPAGVEDMRLSQVYDPGHQEARPAGAGPGSGTRLLMRGREPGF